MAYKKISPGVVVEGGTGNSSINPYTVICGGNSSNAQFNQVSGTGSSGQVLTSTGSSSLPVWASSSPGDIILLNTVIINSATNGFIWNNSYITTTYTAYMVVFTFHASSTTGIGLEIVPSENNGSTFNRGSAGGPVIGCMLFPYNSSTPNNVAPPAGGVDTVSASQTTCAAPTLSGVAYIGVPTTTAFGYYSILCNSNYTSTNGFSGSVTAGGQWKMPFNPINALGVFFQPQAISLKFSLYGIKQ